MICIVFGLPWLMVFSSIGGVLAVRFRYGRARLRASTVAVIAPFVIMPIEARVPLHDSIVTTTSTIDVAAPPQLVWEFVVRVDSIGDVFTHRLTVAKTADNPRGVAWTYAHGLPEMFKGR